MARTIIDPAFKSDLTSAVVRSGLQGVLDDLQFQEFTAATTGTGNTGTLTYAATGIAVLLYNGAIYFESGDVSVSGVNATVNRYMDAGDKWAILYQKADF